jgi:hypothetical protein
VVSTTDPHRRILGFLDRTKNVVGIQYMQIKYFICMCCINVGMRRIFLGGKIGFEHAFGMEFKHQALVEKGAEEE